MGRGLKYYFAPFAAPANVLACVEGSRGKGSSFESPQITNYKNFPYGNSRL
jgi:hypothetical protein